MVRGRYNRITRTVGLALAALFTLAAPLATSDALAAESPAKTAVKADKASPKAAKAPTKKAKKRGKTAKQDVTPTSTKKPRTSTKATKKNVETTTVSATHAGDGAVVHAKHAPSKSAGQTVATSATKPVALASTKDKTHATKKAPKEAKETTSASTRAASASKKASARAPGAKRKTGKKSDGDAERPPCFAPVVGMDRNGLENESFSLVDCKGKPLDTAREKLSILARPWGTPKPVIEPPKKTKKGAKSPAGKDKPGETTADAGEIAPNVRLLDPGLLTRIDTIARHFSGKHISVVSGYRPRSRGSLHQSARAIDLRVTGASNEEVVAFCKTIADTGCGYYPNSSFVHVDVRAPGTGSVSWIDASGPGEAPRYVSAWPPPPESKAPDADVHDGATPEGIEDEVMRDATKPASTTSETTAAPTTSASLPKVTKEADPKDPVPGSATNPGPAKPDVAPSVPAAPPQAPPAK
jgi:Peptidase M15